MSARGTATGLLEDLLEKTSRTFALSIPELPEPLRHDVSVAYLLFRIADTFEDAVFWPVAKKVEGLETFARLLRARDDRDLDGEIPGWLADPPLDDAGYLELLASVPAVLEAFDAIDDPARQIIREHTLRTIDCMASFVRRADETGGHRLRDLADLQAYCYAVAGIVGEMLTELFLSGCPGLEPIAPLLRGHAVEFGEALQLVNILKDAATDADEGRRFLPGTVDSDRVFALAREDLGRATDYVLGLQEAGAPRGVVAFTALPVLLARSTLDRVEQDGPGSKVSRAEVQEITRRLADALDRGRPAVPQAR